MFGEFVTFETGQTVVKTIAKYVLMNKHIILRKITVYRTR